MNQLTRVAAYGIIRSADKFLLCRLSATVPNSPGQWTLPGGGLDFGERPQDAMVREVFEETGLSVEVGGLIAVDSRCAPFNGEPLHSIRILYQAIYQGGVLKYELDGTTDKCEWFTAAQARELPLVDLAKLGVRYAFD